MEFPPYSSAMMRSEYRVFEIFLGQLAEGKSDRRERGIRRDITGTRELVIKMEKSIV